jgi:hypothetical protein
MQELAKNFLFSSYSGSAVSASTVVHAASHCFLIMRGGVIARW